MLAGNELVYSIGNKARRYATTGCSALESVVNEFPEVFDEQLGAFKGPPVKLHLDPNVKPIQLKPRKLPFALENKVEQEIEKLVEDGVLVPVTYTEWATPVVPLLKNDGGIRLCGDYKCTLNKALRQDPYPVPAISHLLAALSGGKHFAKLDLSRAYLQLLVDEESAAAQTIVTHRGAFKCTRLQFGVSTAPGIFQRFIETLLRGIPGVIPYFDDVLIKGSTRLELVQNLRKFFVVSPKLVLE